MQANDRLHPGQTVWIDVPNKYPLEVKILVVNCGGTTPPSAPNARIEREGKVYIIEQSYLLTELPEQLAEAS